MKLSQKCDKINKKLCAGDWIMAVSYKRLLHLMIEKDITNAELMKSAKVSANIISKIKAGQYIALDKVESICKAMGCTPDEMLEFITEQED